MGVEHLVDRGVAEGLEVIGVHEIGEPALQQVLLLFDHMACDAGVPGLDHFLTKFARFEEHVA